MEEPMQPGITYSGEGPARKDQHINLRIAPAEKQLIAEKAARAGLTTGEYIRRAALGRKLVEKVPPELRRQLAATGLILSQLSNLARTGQLPGVHAEALNELVTRLLGTLK
jgi:hypothetical protein